MSHWSYLPLDDASSYYSYPDDFEFGSGDDDDTVFDLAWADMLTRKCRPVRFKGWMDPDKLEDAGAILSRSLMPTLVEGLPGQIAFGDSEAIFPDWATAQRAATGFSGKLLDASVPKPVLSFPMDRDDHLDWSSIEMAEEVGVDATDLLRSYFARRHLKVGPFKSLTPEQETKFQRWLKADIR